MPITSFEDFEKQWRAAEQLENELASQLIQKADELGVSIAMVHDSYELGGTLEKQNKLLAWMKDKIEEIAKRQAIRFVREAPGPNERSARKALVFPILYGTNPKSITQALGITKKQAEKLLKSYNKIFQQTTGKK